MNEQEEIVAQLARAIAGRMHDREARGLPALPPDHRKSEVRRKAQARKEKRA